MSAAPTASYETLGSLNHYQANAEILEVMAGAPVKTHVIHAFSKVLHFGCGCLVHQERQLTNPGSLERKYHYREHIAPCGKHYYDPAFRTSIEPITLGN